MTNVYKTPEKRNRKKRLLQIGIQTLQNDRWEVTKEKGLGKSSAYRITRDGESKLVSIKTTQDRCLSFQPKPNEKGWVTLDDVETVVAVSVDGSMPPKEALVHLLPADDVRRRFDLAYQARKKAGRVLPKGRGLWLPLYRRREDNPANVYYIGGGAGLDYKEIARVPMNGGNGVHPPTRHDLVKDGPGGEENFTIAAAKRRLATSFGVPESSIKIIIEA